MNERSFETLLYTVTAHTVALIAEHTGWTEDMAMERFVSSKLYAFLEQEETKVWQYSTVMLATLFDEERAGRLVLPEV